MEIPKLIDGGTHVDERGSISFVNEFRFTEVKRFYLIEHSNTEVVRAWQGHKIEKKWFYVITGKFKIAVVKPDNWTKPASKVPVEVFELSAEKQQVLYIPNGYANGFKALCSGAKLIIFSTLTVEDSNEDTYRFNASKWYKWD